MITKEQLMAQVERDKAEIAKLPPAVQAYYARCVEQLRRSSYVPVEDEYY